MSDPFAAVTGLLTEQIRTARARGNTPAAAAALEKLLTMYVRLGTRELGTLQEQNDYIVARHLGYLPQALQDLGVTAEDLPEPPGRRRPLPPPPAGVNVSRIVERLAHLGGRDNDEPAERFGVEYRPHDNVVLHGRLQPFAVVDTEEHNLPVSWYENRDDAETVAGTASRLRRAG
ncbi:hypothetical protein ACF08W_29130 [Streptomyces sp. NPDC015144]|uniref:hypothetical protein n=1 Tax=Streptomyces sp. NPDC015144 TaxID=3364944 RepID=UPI0036FD8274